MKSSFFTAWLLLQLFATSGQSTQTIRGTIADQDSRAALPGATIRIVNQQEVTGAITDANGAFRIENVPLGRVTLLITFIGYEDRVINDLLVTAAKEVVLEIALQESIEKLQAVVVTAQSDPSEVLNEMALVSARTFSVEETQRYAGALNDPARMVASFAGVTGNAEGNNDIVVRGNSPRGILWRLQGVEIPNPNHFANEGATGGPINALNSNMLDNSDFYSGAFAPEYGNALSGVFDMRFKKGNNERREYTAGASVFGIDFTAEGPFSQQYGGSFIANYRYSSLQLISELGFLDFGGIPKYQDASFNVHLPIGKKQYLNVFGLGGISSISVDETDEDDNPLYRGVFGTDLGVTGISLTSLINDRTFVKNAITLSATSLTSTDELPLEGTAYTRVAESSIDRQTVRATSTLHHKWNAQHKTEAGLIYSYNAFRASAHRFEFETDQMNLILDEDGGASVMQAYGTWKYRPAEQWTVTSGVHYLWSELSRSHSVEPRVALQWSPAQRHEWTLGYGLHSRLESTSVYLTRVTNEDGTTWQPNRTLKPTKASHLVLGYGYQLGPLTRLKAEAYYQHLFDVPVEQEASSTFSLINSTESFAFVPLENSGTGRNYGLELTVERFFSKGFYYMSTLSLYQSKYTAADGVERNTAFNGNYVANVLAGKEWATGAPQKGRVMFTNVKVGLLGGARYTPIDLEASRELGDEVRDETRPYGLKGDDVFFLNVAWGLRRNKGNTTREFKLDITNLTNHQGIVNEYYIHGTGQIEQSPQLPFLPNIVYTHKF